MCTILVSHSSFIYTHTHLTANENKKRNILTCNELPSVELKEEKSGKKVRVKISGGGETEHVYTRQRFHTTDDQKHCKMQKPCERCVEICCYCQQAL